VATAALLDPARCAVRGGLRRHQPLDLGRELEAELARLVVRQPVGHLREDDAVELYVATAPGRGRSRLRALDNEKELGADSVGIGEKIVLRRCRREPPRSSKGRPR
jgi:hypothetical protein